MSHAAQTIAWSVLAWLLAFAAPPRAEAQLRTGTWRLFMDVDVLALDWVRTTQRGQQAVDTTVLSIGPNQLGASRLWIPTTPLGVGVGYVLKSHWMVDLRAGVGLDIAKASNSDDAATFIAWSFMPGLLWAPSSPKLYLKFSPVLDFVQTKQGASRQRHFGGCFSAGAGSFFFLGETASFDIGAFFEGRFPDLDQRPANTKIEFADLRVLARAGVSLWR